MSIQPGTGCYTMPQNIGHLTRANIAKSGHTAQPPSPSTHLSRTPDQHPVILGKITKSNPTVSHLLQKSSLKDQCWNIIYDPVNASKPYNKIQPGTTVAYDPSSGRLLWGDDLSNFQSQLARAQEKDDRLPLPCDNDLSLPKDLSLAVKSFIGLDYDDMDCFELVVGGLQNLGVQYKGKNGLGRHLINQAVSKGLPQNAYLNGEGLVAESGQSVYTKTLYHVKNPKIQAENLMNEMENLLAQGQVLSFSTRDKGHTGVISKASDQWTFINSGKMDHNIRGNNGRKKVGEEDLKLEIENWLNLAKSNKQGLKITLGALNLDQLSLFRANSIDQQA